MEEEDEFGSFPDGIDFNALDEAVTQFSSQYRRSCCAYKYKQSSKHSTSPSPMAMTMTTTSTKDCTPSRQDDNDDEFGSFPDGIDFNLLDQAINQRLNSQQPRSVEVIGTKSKMENNVTSDIIIVIDDSDSDEEEGADKSRGSRDPFASSDDEQPLNKSSKKKLTIKSRSKNHDTREGAGDDQKNDDDIIVIRETLTSKQLSKRKFDIAVATGNVIIIDADANASNCETFKKRQKVNVHVASPSAPQCQVVISPEKELQQQDKMTSTSKSQPVFLGQQKRQQSPVVAADTTKGAPTTVQQVQQKIKIYNPYIKKPKAPAATINSNNINQYQNRKTETKAIIQTKAVSVNDNCDCGNPHKKINGRHICRYFGTFECPNCSNCWKTANCWKGEKQACKRCDVFSFPIRKDKLDGRPPRGGGDGHDSNRCGLCRRLGYKSPCYTR